MMRKRYMEAKKMLDGLSKKQKENYIKVSNRCGFNIKRQNKSYGTDLAIDLYGCDRQIISSKKELQRYVDKLCRLIKMKKYGQTIIHHFGHKKAHTAGYSLVQLIETSSITGHFSELWCSAYINIFSCKKFNTEIATKFSKDFFRAEKVIARIIDRA